VMVPRGACCHAADVGCCCCCCCWAHAPVRVASVEVVGWKRRGAGCPACPAGAHLCVRCVRMKQKGTHQTAARHSGKILPVLCEGGCKAGWTIHAWRGGCCHAGRCAGCGCVMGGSEGDGGRPSGGVRWMRVSERRGEPVVPMTPSAAAKSSTEQHSTMRGTSFQQPCTSKSYRVGCIHGVVSTRRVACAALLAGSWSRIERCLSGHRLSVCCRRVAPKQDHCGQYGGNKENK
jgi:hypothetical protein